MMILSKDGSENIKRNYTMGTKKLDIIPLYDWGMFTEPRPSVVAGPCSAETEEQVMETAKGLKELGINVYRAGIWISIWQPRTKS